MKATIIGALISVAAMFFIYFLGNEKPDVVYTVSDNIPSSFEKSDSNIQQITVKNLGEEPAKSIQVLIDEKVYKSRVIKDSEQDNFNEYPDDYELVYNELPPEGSFRLIVETSKNGLNESVLTVKSKNGLARNGLENNSNSFFILFYSVVIVIYLALSLQNSMTQRYITKYTYFANLSPINKLHRKKPFYFIKGNWTQLLTQFADAKIKNDLKFYFTDLASMNSYLILTLDKPEIFTDEEWHNITNNAKDTLIMKIKYSFIHYSTETRLVEFLSSFNSIKHHLTHPTQLEISKDISDHFINFKINKKVYIDVSEINKSLREAKPDFVNEDDWDRYISHLKRLQYIFLLKEMYPASSIASNDAMFIFKENKDNIVEDHNRNLLKNIAYNIEYYKLVSHALKDLVLKEKSEWMEDYEYDKIKKIVEQTKKMDNDSENIKKTLMLVENTVLSLEIPNDKPDYVTKSHWDKLNKYKKSAEDINNREKIIEDKESALVDTEKELHQLKEKIERQLNIIDDMFEDPSSIYKIEDYSIPFASGNFNNLKRLAENLRNHDLSKG